MKKILTIALACLCCCVGCKTFQGNTTNTVIVETVQAAAKKAVLKWAYKRIEDAKNLDDEAKAVLEKLAEEKINELFEKWDEKFKEWTKDKIEEVAKEEMDERLDFLQAGLRQIAAPAPSSDDIKK